MLHCYFVCGVAHVNSVALIPMAMPLMAFRVGESSESSSNGKCQGSLEHFSVKYVRTVRRGSER